MVKKKTTGRDEAKRQFLEDWVVDPTFAQSKYKYTTAVVATEAESSDEEVYTRDRLEHAIGKKDASHLIDGGHLEAAKDKYGRDGFKYGTSRKHRGVARTRTAAQVDEMDLNPQQAKRIRDGLANASIGLVNRGRKVKTQPELSEAEQAAHELVKSLKKAKGNINASIAKSLSAVKDLTGNKHVLASKVKTQMEKHLTTLQNRLSDFEKSLSDIDGGTKVKKQHIDKILASAQLAVDNFTKDHKIAKSL
jgi:polyhydroxyalkanoate synthesis regulator phasin